MNKRVVCAMGNSHLAAAKLGWQAVADRFPAYEFEFFGFPPGTSRSIAEHFEVRDRSIVPVTDVLRRGFEMTAGKTKIDADRYSAFAFFGLGLGGPSNPVNSIYPKYSLAEHPVAGAFLVSKACLRATIEDRLRSESTLVPLRAIRALSDAPVFWQSTPVPSARIIGDPAYAKDAISNPAIVSLIKEIYDAKSAEIGALESYRYLKQPPTTLDESGLTLDAYISNGVSFTGRAKKDNISHGNQAYGILIVRALLSELDKALS